MAAPGPGAEGSYTDSYREGSREGKVHSIFTRVAVPMLRFLSPLILPHESWQVANIALRCFRPRTSGRQGLEPHAPITPQMRRWYAARTAQRAILYLTIQD